MQITNEMFGGAYMRVLDSHASLKCPFNRRPRGEAEGKLICPKIWIYSQEIRAPRLRSHLGTLKGTALPQSEDTYLMPGFPLTFITSIPFEVMALFLPLGWRHWLALLPADHRKVKGERRRVSARTWTQVARLATLHDALTPGVPNHYRAMAYRPSERCQERAAICSKLAGR